MALPDADTAMKPWLAFPPLEAEASSASHFEAQGHKSAYGRRKDVVVESKGFDCPDTLTEMVKLLRDCRFAARVRLQKLCGSRSGALVLVMTPLRADGMEMITMVLKYDESDKIVEEVELTRQHGARWGPRHPKVHECNVKGKWGVMLMELCGGRYGVPGLTKGNASTTLRDFMCEFLTGNRPSSEMQKVVKDLGSRLKDWSMIGPASLDLYAMYRTGDNIQKRILAAKRMFNMPQPGSFPMLPAGVSLPDFFKQFIAFFDALPSERRTQSTRQGYSHGDFHGGNLLLDVNQKLWMIDYATFCTSHSHDDLAKLLVATLVIYLSATQNGEDDFRDLCLRVATCTSTTTTFPPARTPPDPAVEIARTEEFVVAMWPIFCQMDPDNESGAPFVWAVFRHAVRMCSYEEPNEAQRLRSVFLATACAARLLSDHPNAPQVVNREFMQQYKVRWGGLTRQAYGSHTSNNSADTRRMGHLEAYLGQIGTLEGWQVDPVSREKVSVAEACVRTATERLPGQNLAKLRRRWNSPEFAKLVRASRRLSAKLEDIFPEGIPWRLLVQGPGGVGKTVLTKQIVLESCQAHLDATSELVDAFIPFRFSFKDLAAFFETKEYENWDLIRDALTHTYGAEALQVFALELVTATEQCVLLILDGMDEIPFMLDKALRWLRTFEEFNNVCIIVTSRPVPLEGSRDELGDLGFELRRILPLTPQESQNMLDLMTARLQVSPKDKAALEEEINRPEYAQLISVPITMNLLTHVLLHRGVGHGVMSKTQLYEHATVLMMNSESLRSEDSTLLDKKVGVEDAMQRIAFSNHLKGRRGQPWDAYTEVDPNILHFVKEQVDLGLFSALEVSDGKVSFPHLSFQEFFAAKGMSRAIRANRAELDGPLGPWLQDRSGEHWWSLVVLMAIELLE